MTFDSSKLVAVSYPIAREIAGQINGSVNVDKLSKIGIAGPTAIALAAIISSGGAGGARDIGALHRSGFCASDAAAIVAAAIAAGAH